MGLVTGFFLLTGEYPASAQAKKKEQVGKTPSPSASTRIPEITRIAVFQSQRGEHILRSPLAIVLDEKNGDLIVTSFESGEVVVLDKNGALVKRLGTDAGLVSPYGVAIDGKGRIYVSEVRSGFLKILSPSGTLVDEIDLSKVMGKTVSPGRITLDINGLIYIADLNNNEILVFNGKGDFVRSLGTFEYLQKAGALGDDRIVGLSAQGKAVKVFSREGALLHSFGDHGDSSDRNMSFPTGFAVDAKGRLWIADAFQHRLKVFSLDGKFLFNFGRMEEKVGGFFFPVDICFGEKGKLFVLEKGADRIQVFHISDLGE
jgi:DNA-binding beta-propeller fold protein YncE